MAESVAGLMLDAEPPLVHIDTSKVSTSPDRPLQARVCSAAQLAGR